MPDNAHACLTDGGSLSRPRTVNRWSKYPHHARNYEMPPRHSFQEFGSAKDLDFFVLEMASNLKQLVWISIIATGRKVSRGKQTT